MQEEPTGEEDEEVTNWETALNLWPLEKRDPYFRKKSVINSMDLNQVLKLIEMYREDEKEKSEQKKANKGGAKADEKIPITTFDTQDDDRKTLIHKASLLRLPVDIVPPRMEL